MEIDFVLHDVPGPAANWAANAQRGDLIGMLGPSGGQVGPADSYLIVGDETALPAISRLLDDLPAQSRGVALIEVQNEAEVQQISRPEGLEIHWLLRGSAHSGTTVLLQDAVMKLPKPPAHETFFAWISCEYTACNAIRAHLRDVWHTTRENSLATSYWRRGMCDEGSLEKHDGHDH